jgi:hypothetical protein
MIMPLHLRADPRRAADRPCTAAAQRNGLAGTDPLPASERHLPPASAERTRRCPCGSAVMLRRCCGR